MSDKRVSEKAAPVRAIARFEFEWSNDFNLPAMGMSCIWKIFREARSGQEATFDTGFFPCGRTSVA
jgi:hypothetical protein